MPGHEAGRQASLAESASLLSLGTCYLMLQSWVPEEEGMAEAGLGWPEQIGHYLRECWWPFLSSLSTTVVSAVDVLRDSVHFSICAS